MTSPAPNIFLLSVTAAPPADAEGMLLELGDGESGFAGTPVGTGDATLEEFVDQCRALDRGEQVPKGRVPSTTYWIVQHGKAAGLLRLRHYLNDALRHKGGHIGYYVRPSCRGQGVAKQGLALALPHANALGETRVMLTTNPSNTHSVKVIEANGGKLTATLEEPADHTDAKSAETILQFWIDT